MKNKTNKSGVIIITITVIFLLVLLNLFTFLIPFTKISTSVLLLTYICTEVVILAVGIITILSLFTDEEANQKIISLPIIQNGIITSITQILATIVFFVLNALITVQLWVVIIVECLILFFGTFQIMRGYFFKTRNADYHENKANTTFINEFRARLKALVAINQIASVAKALEDLYDTARGSDPISTDKTLDSENELLLLLQELDDAIKQGSTDRTGEIIKQSKNTLLERNALCQNSK